VGWIKSFISQFLGKRALEQHSLKLPIKEEVAFDMITTDRSPLCYPAWSVIEETIREVMGSTEAAEVTLDKPPEAVISDLKKRIYATQSQNKMIRDIRALLSSGDPTLSIKFPSGLHCELIPGAFLTYPKLANPTNDERLLSITKVLLSCPCFYPLDNR
jgi:hypothetical protein